MNVAKISFALLIAGLASLVMLFPTDSHAATWAARWGTIGQLLVESNGVQVILNAPPNPPSSFDSERERAFYISGSDANYASKIATITSAYYAGHEVHVEYNGTRHSWHTAVARFKVRPVSP